MEWYPLSVSQSDMLLDEYFCRNDDPTVISQIGFYGYLEDGFDPDLLERAFGIVVDACDALHIQIVADRKEKKQRFLPEVPFQAIREEMASKEAFLSFVDGHHPSVKMTDDVLFRLHLVSTGEQSGGILVLMHHACGDGYSMEYLMNKLETVYTGLLNGETPQLKSGSFKEYLQNESAYYASEQYQKDCKWWKQNYKNHKKYYVPFGTPSANPEAAMMVFDLTGERYDRLLSLQAATGVSLPTIMMTAISLTIAKMTGHLSTPIYCLTHGRTTFKQKQTCGCMVNTVPVLMELHPDDTLAEQLKFDYRFYLETLSHGRLPLIKHIRFSRRQILRNRALSHSWMVFSSMGFGSFADSRFGWRPLAEKVVSTVTYLALMDTPAKRCYHLSLRYQTEKISSAKAEAIRDCFSETVDAMLKDPHTTVAELIGKR